MNKKVILFDINETVLNLGALKPIFKETFGSEDALSLWFSKLLHLSTVCITTKVKSNFAELATIVLDAIAVNYKIQLTEDQRTELLGAFSNLSPHSDIKPALSKLRQHGFKVVALSNSSLNLISMQMKNAELTDSFDDIISVEETGSFKPDPTVYKFAATKLQQPIDQLCLVATHDWDTHGALSAGLDAAYIDRMGVPYNPLYLKPKIHSTTMGNLVDSIIADQA
ncbi:haloacid dehalogenase type II [Photobacterium phosphoreum]|uniref:haloacid dehalogenase type II n=1 Tax=Photobacterium phosphoreum TaxID=659 RepID=UPI000D155119|nr:haloacid dehalogenase type II [Photobacterium phosphoreum]MCD9479109.1 haloacid dehalogenase type II [Photobacterium phosphoreum]PSU40029.1 haloacid dehalogenase type II [Photobacterium phosphoreum]PSW41339.1 haloacid dehalogenase type II [Photobacterium phosphoreum]